MLDVDFKHLYLYCHHLSMHEWSQQWVHMHVFVKNKTFFLWNCYFLFNSVSKLPAEYIRIIMKQITWKCEDILLSFCNLSRYVHYVPHKIWEFCIFHSVWLRFLQLMRVVWVQSAEWLVTSLWIKWTKF